MLVEMCFLFPGFFCPLSLFVHFFLSDMCTSSASSELNRLIVNDDDPTAPLIVVVYGPYMN
jgi:hypothetical protein